MTATPEIATSAAETRRILACRHVRGEMHEQPDVLGRMSRHVEHFARQTGALTARHGGFRDVVFLAPARSQPVAILGRHAVLARCGPRPLPPRTGSDAEPGSRLIVALSPSGQDERVLELSARALESGSAVVAVTNDARSPLAALAAFAVDIAAGLELSAAPTKSVTAMMLAVLALVDGLPTEREVPPVIADPARALALADAVAELLAEHAAAQPAAGRLVTARRVAVLGEGHHLPAALETARMLRETAGLLVEGFSVEEFCAGPLGGFDDETAAVLLAGAGHEAVRALRARLRDRGAHIVVIGDAGDAGDDPAAPVLPLPRRGVSGSAECILATVRGQQLAVATARALGIDPDRPAVTDVTAGTRRG
jgi:glucosamine--fructose-6-phosphate aminotransferase (isomerizing)